MITRNQAQVLLRTSIRIICALLVAGSIARAEVGPGNLSAQIAQTPAMPEYLVKSAMLYHFARFTKWPQDALDDPDLPYRFCVIGQDPFGPDLDALLEETIQERDIVTTRLRKIQHAKNCHLLFIAESEKENLSAILDQLGDQPILTIADMENFAGNGGIIELKLVEDSVRFEINLGVAKQIGLTFRSELLLLADTIAGSFKRNRFDVLSE